MFVIAGERPQQSGPWWSLNVVRVDGGIMVTALRLRHVREGWANGLSASIIWMSVVSVVVGAPPGPTPLPHAISAGRYARWGSRPMAPRLDEPHAVQAVDLAFAAAHPIASKAEPSKPSSRLRREPQRLDATNAE
ncbi:hypothetical protein MRS44_007478 [Fusarium solani]|uniref:uncharacterized protein n=1 Tax=Fusarium solani TaxID=169388 RepID=UPI0032C45CF3|nr:hypothetical protein MRS44_007478 [Fusarium solani]